MPASRREDGCYFCGATVTEDMRCGGCKEYICDDCSIAIVARLPKNHAPEEHME